MVGISTSCDPTRLKKVLIKSRAVMKGFYGLTSEDKEDILIDVMYRFEVDQGRFPDSVYERHCKNKIIGFLGKKTAKKRMAQKVVDGVTVYLQDVSLSTKIGDEEDMELQDVLAAENDYSIQEVDLLLNIERRTPELVPSVRRVLKGEILNKKEKRMLKEGLTTDIVGPKEIKI